MKSNLDVYAIQNNKEEIVNVLKNIDKDSFSNILYLNCTCRFNIGDRTIRSRIFDSCFYSEDSDTVIFFAKGKISKDEIEKYLQDFDIKYTTIVFNREDKEFEENEYYKDIWFAREKYVLEDAIDDCLKKGVNKCVYFPREKSQLSIGYKSSKDIRDYFEIEGRLCEGTLVFQDKIVLLISQGDKRNLNYNQTMKLLENKGIKVEIRSNKGR